MTTSILNQMFPDGSPEPCFEKDLEHVIEISVPWNGRFLSLFNERAGVEKKLSGAFTGNFGPGYCAAGANDRMLYHFTKPANT